MSAIITCMGPLLAAGPLASCGTGPSPMSTSKPVALLSEYGLKSWHDSPGHSHKEALTGSSLQFNDGMWVMMDHPLTSPAAILAKRMETGALAAAGMITMTDESIRGLGETMHLYSDVARATKLTSSVLLEPDESIQTKEIDMIANGYWQEQASR